MKIHQLKVDEALRSLHSRREGLSDVEARRRLAEFGLNRVERIRHVPLLVRFERSFTHFFALVLWVAAGLAFLAEAWEPAQGMMTLGYAIVAVIGINGIFSFWQEYRAEKAIEALKRLLPQQATVRRDDQLQRIPVEELVPGDLLLVDAGDLVPADCRIVRSFGIRVNNATVTGESVPIARDEAPDCQEDIVHSRNVLLAGTAVVSGEGETVVYATGMHTEFGRIAHLTQTGKEPLSPLQKEIARLSRFVAVLAAALGGGFFLIGQAVGLSFWANFVFAVGILVANVPEGLLPTVTLALAMATQRMARKNALIRHLPSVETLGAATVICTDKTGTLTVNRMRVERIFLRNRSYQRAEFSSLRQRDPAVQLFLQTALFCHELRETQESGHRETIGDPTDIALVEMARGLTQHAPTYPRVDEVPFDSDRKRLSTLHRTDDGLVLYVKGALESVLPHCGQIRTVHGLEALTAEWKERLVQEESRMAADGLRVLGCAYRSVPETYDRGKLEQELVFIGLVGLEDPPRPEVPAAIQRCRTAGIRVIMVTGDHPHTALAIGRQIGLVEGPDCRVFTGEQLRRLTRAQLQLALDLPEILFARVGADQKVRIVNALRAKGHVVAVTGDGVNDAPALRQADVGIAMGRTGTEVVRAAADMILLDDNFASIVAAVEEGRAVFENIRKFLTYILTSNIPEIVPYLAFVLFRIPLPLTILQILAVDLGTDMLPALGLGADPPGSGVMLRPPRPRTERLLSVPLLLRAYGFLGLMEAAAAMAAFFFVLGAGAPHFGRELAHDDPLYLQATTACLTAIIAMQVANVVLCRDPRLSVFTYGFLTNRLILLGIAVEMVLILLIDYAPLGNRLFGTAPLAVSVWLFILPFPLAMLALEEVRKWLTRRWGQP
jgi:calcium-translocating P-type ATPase